MVLGVAAAVGATAVEAWARKVPAGTPLRDAVLRARPLEHRAAAPVHTGVVRPSKLFAIGAAALVAGLPAAPTARAQPASPLAALARTGAAPADPCPGANAPSSGWVRMADANAPPPGGGLGHAAPWTGSELLAISYARNGAWTALPTHGAPPAGPHRVVTLTATHLVVMGTQQLDGTSHYGAALDLASGRWRATTPPVAIEPTWAPAYALDDGRVVYRHRDMQWVWVFDPARDAVHGVHRRPDDRVAGRPPDDGGATLAVPERAAGRRLRSRRAPPDAALRRLHAWVLSRPRVRDRAP